MTKLRICSSIMSLGLFAIGPLALAQEFPTTPKQETLDEAIRFEKNKIAASEAQARRDAAESTGRRQAAETNAARPNMARKTGQADRSNKSNQVDSTSKPVK